eukprot:Skav232135  [mRNA]  locus=scaffold1744:171169:176101:- [translate_table: standard]
MGCVEANLVWDEITVSAQLISIGYLWCQVFPTENLQELGVPMAAQLKEEEELKVADLQELSSVIFAELDSWSRSGPWMASDRNTSYDVWCTAEFNDFRDDQAGQDLLTPFPKSTILSIESSYYTARVLVQVTKGPASIFCQAYPWALRPFTERPRIPTNLELQTSPFKTNYLNAPNGKGVADAYSKGSFCSEISQDPTVQAGVGLTDAKDPRGPWCYVEPRLCPDAERSQVFPQRFLSYKEVGTGATVPGFPNGGLASTVSEGRGFTWGDQPIIAAGKTYDLCWCNGTASGCTMEADFMVRLGPLHFAGPSSDQAMAVEQNGSRLVVLPMDPRGCRWQRLSEADPLGLTDFPNLGVSETFDQATLLGDDPGDGVAGAGADRGTAEATG